jgi:hypothetical protein
LQDKLALPLKKVKILTIKEKEVWIEALNLLHVNPYILLNVPASVSVVIIERNDRISMETTAS